MQIPFLSKDPSSVSLLPRSRQSLLLLATTIFLLFVVVTVWGLPSGKMAIASPAQQKGAKVERPVLAFYYAWYGLSDWNSGHMSDLPTVRYRSSDSATIARQVGWAARSGITGFISSWWGPGDQTDTNFAKVQSQAVTLEKQSRSHFASTLYIESDSGRLNSMSKMISGLKYAITHYSNDSHFFHWQGKPVIFIWHPLGGGRTLSWWSAVRNQVDPQQHLLWSAEGVDQNLLTVFDGIHLFSAGYWGLLHGNMAQVDQSFRAEVDAYNRAHHTQKIWAAGVLPGYNDTHIPGRQGTFIVPRNNGSTYRTSWQGAMSSNPEWITITSFNEWFEGSMLEPSVSYHTHYLDLTAQFARQWHG